MNTKPLSYRQSQAIRFWIKGGRKSKARALREAGYSNGIVRQPAKVFDSYVVKQELERLGHGSLGILNGQKPKEIVQSVKEEAENTFDISSLSEETIQNLREQLENTTPRNPTVSLQVSKYNDNSSVPVNDPDCNVFGESLTNRGTYKKEMKMSDYSSI